MGTSTPISAAGFDLPAMASSGLKAVSAFESLSPVLIQSKTTCICNETAVTHGVKNSVEMYASHESRLKILHADVQRRSRSAPGQHYTRGSS